MRSTHSYFYIIILSLKKHCLEYEHKLKKFFKRKFADQSHQNEQIFNRIFLDGIFHKRIDGGDFISLAQLCHRAVT